MRILIILCLSLLHFNTQAAGNNLLDSLLSHRHFFQLQRALQSDAFKNLSDHKKLYYQAFLHNFFHDLVTSNKKISLLLSKYRKRLSAVEACNLLMKKVDNHVKLYQYKQAHVTSQLLLNQYHKYLTPEERIDVANSDKIWKGLENVAPQTTTINTITKIPYQRDVARLINVPVQFADSTYDFVFDTGANLSVINESHAKKVKLRMLNVRFKVRAITGLQVQAKLGVAARLKMGSITVRNVVFMVFPDSALSFAHGLYTIKGIIGFPVIEQLQEVRIYKDNITVPQLITDRNIRNFGVDELLPVITIAYKTDTLAFTFDTGAQYTFLNEPFYKRYRTEIDTAGRSFDLQVGGAGGVRKTKAFRLPQIAFTVATQPAVLDNVSVKTSSTSPKDKLYFGNLGQDVMNQFREMIINFRYMYVDFIP
jgi:hypothetical protein